MVLMLNSPVGILGTALVILVGSCSRTEAPTPAALSAKPMQTAAIRAQPKFAPLSAADTASLDKQRALVDHELATRYQAHLSRSRADLVLIQRLLDDRAFGPTQTYELQSLGVAFGDVLTVDTPLRWMIVSDEYGTDPTLLLPGTTLQVNCLTMISKRVEDGEHVDVSDLFSRTIASVRNPPADLK